MQVRPDARSYRNRTLPNFNDLCLIYGNEESLKRESSSNHSMDAEDDDPRVNVGTWPLLSLNKTGFTFNENIGPG